MYEEIFNDFNTVQKHCKQHGITAIEESAIFELLENLHPQHGSIRAIQIVIDMLNAQKLRDIKNFSYRSDTEGLSNDKYDDDSIVELDVPPKVHPVIDLISNSPESNDAYIIEKPINDNFFNTTDSDLDCDYTNDDSNATDDYYSPNYYSLNFKRFLDAVSDRTFDRKIEKRIVNQPNLIQFEEDQSNSNIGDTEILEENNNDPNNNLHGRIMEEESTNVNNTVNNNVERVNTSWNNENSNSKSDIDLINSIPGCSKDTETEVNIRKKNADLPYTLVRESSSPIPGCSKYSGDSNDLNSPSKFDDSIYNDAFCIQEIVPWADLKKICSILKKHNDSLNRKQLTLWDLMKQQSNQSICVTPNKRKQDDDTCTISKKSVKVADNDYFDEALFDLEPNSQLNSIVCDESSSDSVSSKASNCNESKFEIIEKNQHEQIPTDIEPLKTIPIKMEKVIKTEEDSVNLSNQSDNNTSNKILQSENLNLLMSINLKPKNELYIPNHITPKISQNSFKNCFIKKERNETIVSGSLCENLPDADGISKIEKVKDEYKNNSNKLSENSNELETTIKKENGYIQNRNISSIQNFENLKEDSSVKSNKVDVIKPAKLILQSVKDFENLERKSCTTTSYIRPAIFSYTNVNNERESKMKINNDINSSDIMYKKKTLPSDDQIIRPPKRMLKSYSPINDSNSRILTTNSVPVIKTMSAPSDDQIIRPPKRMSQSYSSINVSNSGFLTTNSRPIIKEVSNEYNRKLMKTNTYQDNLVATSTPKIPLEEDLLPVHKWTLTPTGLKKITKFVLKPSAFNVDSNSLDVSNKEPDRSIYDTLRSMFPSVKSSYVKKICIADPMKGNDKEAYLNVLIDHLLNHGHNHLRPVENYIESYIEQQSAIKLSVDEQYEYLLGIFPDADPTYLRNIVEQNLDGISLEEFIQQKLELRNYPTKEQYLAKIKITEQQKQYTTDFKVEQFLEVFPDPFVHFENKNRKSNYQPIAMEFLKAFFNKYKVTTISHHYRNNGYNLSLTAKTLSMCIPDMKSKRMTIEMPTENIPLLQELAFIKNRKDIRNYIDTLKTKEEQLFKELQEKNLLVTCQCCFNDECMPTKCSECNEGHLFCHECIIRGTEIVLANGEVNVRCFTECKSEFSLVTLQKVLPPTKFSALLKKRQTAEVMAAEVEGLVSCPFCYFASIPPPEDKIFKCLNPECMKESCRQCRELNHIPLRCDEVIKTDQARRLIEEKMTEALLRTCYKCKKEFYKEEGCNRMECPCGALMCYLCNKPVQRSYQHFNPQGGANASLCPLWSDDRLMNARAVIKVAEDVKKAIIKKNPNLQIDTQSLLPKLPPKTKGPHDDIMNSNELPQHVKRVANVVP